MELKKIMWPTDLSGRAENALPYINSLIEKYNTKTFSLEGLSGFDREFINQIDYKRLGFEHPKHAKVE